VKVTTKKIVTHTIDLDDSERFRVTTQTKRPKTLLVMSVTAEDKYGRWVLELRGSQIRQDGTEGQGLVVGVWGLCEGMEFKDADRAKLWAVLTPAVREKLAEIGVSS
jgi:hypothetical protein